MRPPEAGMAVNRTPPTATAAGPPGARAPSSAASSGRVPSTAAFDAIVVGAGPAGTSAALGLAQAGAKVLLLERGEYPGAKNMFGGMMAYCPGPRATRARFLETRAVGAGGDQTDALHHERGLHHLSRVPGRVGLGRAGCGRGLDLRPEPHRVHPLPAAVRPLVRRAGGRRPASPCSPAAAWRGWW